MPATQIIRSFDATIEDVNPTRKSVVARINTSARDRYNTVILAKGCKHKAWRAGGGPVLWEHARHEFKDPIATADRLWNNGGPSPTEIIAEPVFLDSEFAQDRFRKYESGILRCWSVNCIPTPGTYGPPSRDELRSHPEWEGVDTVYRDWDLIEFSGTIVPGNAEALTTTHAAKIMEMVARGMEWMPPEAEPFYRAAMDRVTVVMPGLPEPDAEFRAALIPGIGPLLAKSEGGNAPDAAALVPIPEPAGTCPLCGARVKERRPDGNDQCESGHVYPIDWTARTMTDSLNGLAAGGAAVKEADADGKPCDPTCPPGANYTRCDAARAKAKAKGEGEGNEPSSEAEKRSASDDPIYFDGHGSWRLRGLDLQPFPDEASARRALEQLMHPTSFEDLFRAQARQIDGRNAAIQEAVSEEIRAIVDLMRWGKV